MSQYVNLMLSAQMAAEKVAEITIYGVISSYKYSETVTAKEIKDELDKVKDAKKLIIHINSPGGSVYQGLAIMTNLKAHKADRKEVYIEGLCASAATLPTLIANYVYMYEGTEFMIHNPTDWAWGTSKELRKAADDLEMMQQSFCSMYAKRCGKPEDEVQADMDKEKWLTADKAKEYGFVDEVIPVVEERTSQAACTKGQIQMLGYKNIPKELLENLPDSIAPSAACGRNLPHEGGRGGTPHQPPMTAASPQGEATPSVLASLGNKEGGLHAESAAQTAFSNMISKEGTQMTPEELRKQHPDAVAQIENAAKQNGVNEERARMQALDKVALPGYEQMIKDAKYGEKTLTAAEVSMQIIEAQMAKGPAFVANRQAESVEMNKVPAATVPDKPSTTAEEDAAANKCAAFAPAKGSMQTVQG